MACFLLVHGAWHGAWCWRFVVDRLIREGHEAHAVTLTGLGDRRHLLSPSVSLQTHILDVEHAIESLEWDHVTLAVHSYAGMLGTAIADRMPKRLQHLIYVDAVVPKPGESWSSTHTRATREARLGAAASTADFSFPVPDASGYGLTGAEHDWVQRRMTPHPGHTYEAPLDFDVARVAGVPRTFVNCTAPALATIDAIRLRMGDPRFWDGAWLHGGGGVQRVDLATGHDPMVSQPAELTKILLDCAAPHP